MSMRMPVGELVYRDIDMSTVLIAIPAFRQALIDAGWTNFENLYERFDVTIDRFNANEGATITIGAAVYTFKATPTGANDIAINANFYVTRDNAIAKINAVDPLVGATRGDVADTSDNAWFQLINRTSGVHADIPVSKNTARIGLTLWRYGGHLFYSATSDVQPLRAAVEISTDGVDIRWRCFSVDKKSYSPYYWWAVINLRLLKFSADGQQFITWMSGAAVTAGCLAHFCVPFVFEGMEPLVVSSVTASPTNNYRVTFASDHGMGDGQNLYIDQATFGGSYINTLNGSWQVTVISPTVLDLNASTYVAGYNAGTGLGATYKRHSRMFFAMGNFRANYCSITFRHNLQAMPGYGQHIDYTMCCDSSFYYIILDSTGGHNWISLFTMKSPFSNIMCKVAAVGQLDGAMVPIIGWKWPTDAEPMMMMAQIPRALIVQDDIDMDQTFVHAGFNWTNYTNNHGDGSLVFALTIANEEDAKRGLVPRTVRPPVARRDSSTGTPGLRRLTWPGHQR